LAEATLFRVLVAPFSFAQELTKVDESQLLARIKGERDGYWQWNWNSEIVLLPRHSVARRRPPLLSMKVPVRDWREVDEIPMQWRK